MFNDFGIEVISVPLNSDGIDIEAMKSVLETHDNILGIICVPRHSNPSGEVYSDQNIKDIFSTGISMLIFGSSLIL